MCRKYWTIFFFICIVNNPGYTQNLLPNGDFREQLTCIEFNQKCAPMGWRLTSADPPTYFKEFKNNDSIAFISWTAFVAFSFIEKQYREYLQAPLLCRLKKGEKYLFSITLKPEKYAIREFGVRFTDSATITGANTLVLGKQDIRFYDKNFIGKKDDWTNLTFEYLASGIERYILIGNFLPDEETQYKSERSGKKTMRIAYFITNISLKPYKDSVLCDYSALLKRLRSDRYRHTLFTNQFFQDSLALNLIKKSYKKNAETKNMINVESRDSIVYPVIHFDFDKFCLRDKSVNDLILLALHLKGMNEKIIHVTGHTDNVGTHNYNYALSLKRAIAVKEFLIKQGIRPTQILTDGKGSTEPGSENITSSGRQANRRVEISLLEIN